MPRDTRRSGLSLVLAGLAGAGFFLFTDPRWSWGEGPANIVDSIAQASPGTYVGIAGCASVVLIGLWLMIRRSS